MLATVVDSHSLIIDGYVAMLKSDDQIFETTTMSFIKESNKLGMHAISSEPPPPSAHAAKVTTTLVVRK